MSGRLGEAELQFRRALELDPRSPESWYGLGSVQLGVALPADAAESFKKALALRPEFPEAEVALGLAHKELRQFAEARVHYLRALQLRPGYAQASQHAHGSRVQSEGIGHIRGAPALGQRLPLSHRSDRCRARRCGVIAGDLVIRGSGDPSLRARHIDALAESLARQGVTRVSGDVLGDPRRIGSDELGQGGRSPLRVGSVSIEVHVRPGDKVGSRPVVSIRPASDAFVVVNQARRAPRARGA